ncbi:hypothetical protein [Streptomyces regalis]|uniref:DUF4232 domain-containing protein n=1 Tax=Streptomyces regalis TaxID=68262 RepID=A0A0X3VQI9_9ACTN|nr:hypothetical protein [Streptomyces regalis]KUL46834.1 hypothetical protein ADL12_01970 [Streptomyces regalis]
MNHGPDDQGPEGLDSDELALRRMLQHAVEEIEPRDGTLDHLRRAVPARRARKRQALVGVAAAALFVGTAVPALVHVSNSTGSDVNPSVAGHGEQAQGGSGQGEETEGGESTSGGSSGKTEDQGKGSEKDEDKGTSTGPGTGSGSPDDPSATGPAGTVACTADQLGTSGGTAALPDPSGAVYGTFTFSNVSTVDCTVSSPGTVALATAGAADGKVTDARHVAGDAAAGLPDPAQELTSLVLKPGDSYQVKFAWVPSETCPTTSDPSGGGTGGNDPSPTPTPTEDNTGTTDGTSTGGDTGTTTQLMTEDTTADGSVTVSNTTEAAGPTASVTVSNACAGIVYWTGVLAGA